MGRCEQATAWSRVFDGRGFRTCGGSRIVLGGIVLLLGLFRPRMRSIQVFVLLINIATTMRTETATRNRDVCWVAVGYLRVRISSDGENRFRRAGRGVRGTFSRGREDFFGALDICGTCDSAAGVRSGQVVRLWPVWWQNSHDSCDEPARNVSGCGV